MKISSSPYQLKSSQALNSKVSAGSVAGVLLKVDYGDGVGYSSLQPWTVFGDSSLETYLEQIARGQFDSALVAQALSYANLDYEARKAQVNVLAWFPAVKNNYLVNEPEKLTPELLETIRQQGFEFIKFKVGRDTTNEIAKLNSLDFSGFTLRFDFNAALNKSEFISYMENLNSKVKAKIEYIEDPIPYELRDWTELAQNFVLALDQELPKVDWNQTSHLPFQVLIIKPAKMDCDIYTDLCLKHKLKFTITNYMDHSVGTVFALYEASRWQHRLPESSLVAGCYTQHILSPDLASFPGLNFSSSQVQASEVPGVGFTAELERLEWKNI